MGFTKYCGVLGLETKLPKEVFVAYKARIQKKNPLQKEYCFYPPHSVRRIKAILEAAYGRARIRCCNVEECQFYAMRVAVDNEMTLQEVENKLNGIHV